MNNRNLTALIFRISGIYLFTTIFDQFGFYTYSVYITTAVGEFEKILGEPVNKFYGTSVLLIILNIVVSLFLIIKAGWISEKIIKKNHEIKIELNTKSLAKVILLTVAIIWLASSIYIFPKFANYCIELILKLNGNENIILTDFPFASYILKTILTIIIIFRIEKISNWITNKI